jgi:hypothetical protein
MSRQPRCNWQTALPLFASRVRALPVGVALRRSDLLAKAADDALHV